MLFCVANIIQFRLTNLGPPSHLFCLLRYITHITLLTALSNLMSRPELVKSNPTPLCSDALTGWVLSDPEYHVHNQGKLNLNLTTVVNDILYRGKRFNHATVTRGNTEVCQVVGWIHGREFEFP